MNILKNNIEEHFKGKITKDELINQIKAAYSKLMTKDFLEPKELCNYPLLSRLCIAYEDDKDNGTDKFWDNELHLIYSILCGSEDKAFFFRMALPWKYDKFMSVHSNIYDRYSKFRQAVRSYTSGKMKNYSDIKEQLEALDKAKGATGILGLLEIKIISLAEEIFSDDDYEAIQTDVPFLYPGKSLRNNEILLRLLSDYLDRILGEKAITTEVIYLKGEANLNFYCLG